MIALRYLLGFFLQFFPCALLCMIPFWDEIERRRRALLLFGVVMLSVIGTAGYWAFIQMIGGTGIDYNTQLNGSNFYMAGLITLSVIAFFITVPAGRMQKLFVFLLVLNYAAMIFGMTNFHTVYVEGNNPVIMYGGYTDVLLLIVTAVTYPFMIYLLRSYVKGILKISNRKIAINTCLVVIVLTVLSVALLMIVDYSHVQLIQGIILYVGLCVLIISIYVFMFQLITNFGERYKLEQEKELAQLEMQSHLIQYKNMKKQILEDSRIRHDMRHHVRMVVELLQKGKVEDTIQYLEQFVGRMDEIQCRKYCKNPFLDALFAFYDRRMREEHIVMETDLDIQEHIAIDDVDITIVFGNYLENAMEACQKISEEQRFVKIKAYQKGDILIVVARNSFDGTVKTQEGQLLSTKREGIGVGLNSIREVVQNYQGTYEVFWKENVFYMTLGLNMPEAWKG